MMGRLTMVSSNFKEQRKEVGDDNKIINKEIIIKTHFAFCLYACARISALDLKIRSPFVIRKLRLTLHVISVIRSFWAVISNHGSHVNQITTQRRNDTK